MITNIIKKYINRRTDKLLEELIVVVSDLTNSIVDMHDRQTALEETIKCSLKPKYTIKNGKIEMS